MLNSPEIKNEYDKQGTKRQYQSFRNKLSTLFIQAKIQCQNLCSNYTRKERKDAKKRKRQFKQQIRIDKKDFVHELKSELLVLLNQKIQNVEIKKTQTNPKPRKNSEIMKTQKSLATPVFTPLTPQYVTVVPSIVERELSQIHQELGQLVSGLFKQVKRRNVCCKYRNSACCNRKLIHPSGRSYRSTLRRLARRTRQLARRIERKGDERRLHRRTRKLTRRLERRLSRIN